MARPVCLLCWEYPDFVRKPTCKNGRQPKATNAALCRGTARTRGGPRPRPRVDARALRAGRTTLQSSFPRCHAPCRAVRRARRWSRSGPRTSGAINSSCSSRWRRWSWTIFHLAGSRTRSPQSRVWGASAADASRHRRCGLPKIARMPTLASPNRVLHRGTPVKPSPGRAIAGWHVPAGLTITDVSRCFAKNRTTC